MKARTNIKSELPIETNYDKGVSLERIFCGYMKYELKYNRARTRAQMKSFTNSYGSNVDIIAQRFDSSGKIIKVCGWLEICIGLFLCAYYIFYDSDNVALYLAFPLLVFGVAVFVISDRYNLEHAWVECKNTKTKVSFDQMQKTIYEFEQYAASGDKRFKFTSQFFVSTVGFTAEALRLAMDKNVHCYMIKNGTFGKVSYWDN